MIMEGLFYFFEGWLIYRASKDGKKTTFLMILLILGIISQVLTFFGNGFNVAINASMVGDLLSFLIKVFILTQVYKVRKEAQE